MLCLPIVSCALDFLSSCCSVIVPALLICGGASKSSCSNQSAPLTAMRAAFMSFGQFRPLYLPLVVPPLIQCHVLVCQKASNLALVAIDKVDRSCVHCLVSHGLAVWLHELSTAFSTERMKRMHSVSAAVFTYKSLFLDVVLQQALCAM